MPQDTRSISFGHSVPQMPESSGRSYILTIGIDKYEHLPKLRNAVKDALEVTQLLVSKYQFSETDVTYLLNEQATQKNIFQAFSTLIKIVKPEDIVLLYFSGHGIVQDDINEGYWIPVDGDRGNPGTYIANSSIVNYLRSIKSLHTFVIADSCFSGSMFRGESMRDFTDRQEAIPSRWLMTSGRDTPVSDGKPGENSPFADSILLHLRENQREALPVTSLFRSVSEDVGNNHDQLPRCEPLQGVGHRGGEFALRLKGSVPPPSKIDRDNVQNLDRAGAPQPTIINWQRMALWALGVVFTVTSLLLGYNFFFGTSEPEKAMLTVKTEAIKLGDILVGQRKTFPFEVFNKGKTSATVNDIRASCHNVIILDTAAAIIAANSKRTYRAEWIAEQPAGEQQCRIVVGGSNVAEQVVILVEANVKAAALETETNIVAPPDPITEPVPGTQKARIVAETTTMIDLKDIGLGSERTFAFKLRNTSSIKASMNPATASCSAVTVAKGGGTNTIQPNALGSYGGVWKANALGAQQCTITIGGSNVEQAVRIVVKANVKANESNNGSNTFESNSLKPTNNADESVIDTKKNYTIRCLTRGIGGIKIWFYDANGKKYERTSVAGQEDVEFSIPQSLSGKIIEVNFKRGSKEDHGDQKLSPSEPFEVPRSILIN